MVCRLDNGYKGIDRRNTGEKRVKWDESGLVVSICFEIDGRDGANLSFVVRCLDVLYINR